jgi:hypothetical protein
MKRDASLLNVPTSEEFRETSDEQHISACHSHVIDIKVMTVRTVYVGGRAI